jgi:hypothetical protein
MSGGGNTDHRAGFLAGGALVGFIVAGVLMMWGAPRLQAAGVGLLVVGIALWIGSIRPDPSTLHLDEYRVRQKHRSLAIGLGLGSLVVIFYVATLVRLGPNALNKKDGFADVNAAKKNVIIEDKSQDKAQCRKAGTC